MNIEMNLSDPALNKMLGIKTGPKKKVNRFWEATELDKSFRHAEAQAIYHEFLDADFNDSVILGALGMSYAIEGHQGVAHAMLRRSYELFDERFGSDLKKHGIDPNQKVKPGDPPFLVIKKSEIENALGTTFKQENNIEKARYWFERAQSRLPLDNADIQNNLATLYINEGAPEKALSHLQRGLKVQPEHSQCLWNMSLCYLELGHYDLGFPIYKNGKRANVRQERNYVNDGTTPEWKGEKGKTIVVYGEQGIGDEIMFASVLHEVIRDCKQVIFECHVSLKEIFKNSFPEVDCYGTREDQKITWVYDPEGKPNYNIEAKIAIGDLPALYRKSVKDFPGVRYLTPTPTSNMKAATMLNHVFTDDKPVVGINWIGGVKRTRVEVRSLSLESMLPILSQDVHWVVLQYTDCADEIFEFENKHGIKLHYWPEFARHVEGRDYDVFAGLVANLDLVISNCSSVIHLAGSMGVPTWCLTPSRPAWRYRLDLDYMPWYGDTVRLFRQAKGSTDWGPVVARVASALDTKLSNFKLAAQDVEFSE